MRIALIHYAAPPVVGGVEAVLAQQARLLKRAGHMVRVLAGRGQAWEAGIPVEVLPRIDSRHPHILRIKASLDAGQTPPEFNSQVEIIEAELERSLRGVEVVIAHNVASLHKNLALTAALYRLAHKAGAPRLILWHHDLAWTTERYRAELHEGYPWDLLRMAWPGARQVVVSEARREELATLYNIPREQITVVPNGLDLAEFLGLSPGLAALVERLGLSTAAPILLAPVRVTRRKNLELALTTLAMLRQEMPGAALVVTGPPGAHNPANQEYLEQLQRLRAELSLQGAAHLLAEHRPDGLAETDVAGLYRLADALFLPSREEGFGIPILEAGLAGLAVFCSDIAPLRALACDEAVYFSPDDNPIEIARRVAERLNGDPGYALRARVRQRYTWSAIYRERIAPLLEQVNG